MGQVGGVKRTSLRLFVIDAMGYISKAYLQKGLWPYTSIFAVPWLCFHIAWAAGLAPGE